MEEIKRPAGPTGNLYEDWGPDALGNVIRKIRLYRKNIARNSNYVPADELRRVWDANQQNPRWRTALAPVITYALESHGAPRPRGRRPRETPRGDLILRIEAARDHPLSWRTYVPPNEIAAHLRANADAAPEGMREFLDYVADMLTAKLKTAGRKGLPRESILRDLAVSAEYPYLAAEYRRLKASDRREFARLCKTHRVNTNQAGDLALQILCDRYYPGRNVGGKGLRVRLSRKGLLKS